MSPNSKQAWVVGAVLLVAGLGLGYWFGASQSYDKGYDQAVADTAAVEEQAAARAAAEAAAAANPFQVTNPLEDVEANPFEKAKRILNPFE